MEFVLETNNLGKRYKDFKALNNFNMHIPKGAIYGLIGKNGAGKTTLIRIICGLQNATNGSYSIYGVKNSDKSIINVRKRIGAIVETPSVYGNLSAIDNLKEQYKIIGMPSYDGLNELLNLVGLKNTGNKKVKNFSLGMKQRLGIAVALASNPDFLILDEPINGLDPEGIIEIRELLLNLNQKRKITILISSHYLDELSKIATYYGFVDNGKIIEEISSNELNKQLEKKTELQVQNSQDFVLFLESEKIPYLIESNQHINLYGEINIQELLLKLAKNNLKVEKIQEKEETLESYFINLIGGDNND